MLGPEVPREKIAGRQVFTSRNFRRIPGLSFELNYVGGDSAQGYVGRSGVGIGNVLLEGQTVNVATWMRNPAIMDGLIGLGVGKGVDGVCLAWLSMACPIEISPHADYNVQGLWLNRIRSWNVSCVRYGIPSSLPAYDRGPPVAISLDMSIDPSFDPRLRHSPSTLPRDSGYFLAPEFRLVIKRSGVPCHLSLVSLFLRRVYFGVSQVLNVSRESQIPVHRS